MRPVHLAGRALAWAVLLLAAGAAPARGTDTDVAGVRVVPIAAEGSVVQVRIGDTALQATAGGALRYHGLPAGRHELAVRWSEPDADAADSDAADGSEAGEDVDGAGNGDGADDADGAGPDPSEPSLGELELEPGAYLTLLLIRGEDDAGTELVGIADDALEELPPSGHASLRVVHARPGADDANVRVERLEEADPSTDPDVAPLTLRAAPLAAGEPVTLPAGRYRLRIGPAAEAPEEEPRITLRSATVYTLFLAPDDELLLTIDGGAPVPVEAEGAR